MLNIDFLFKNNPTLETDRLVLRRLDLTDAEAYFIALSNPETMRHMRWDVFQTVEDAISFLRMIDQKHRERLAFHWGVIDKESQKLIGRVAFINFDEENEKTEIGYVISKHYWNKGLVTEAIRELIRFGFAELGVNRIEARCNEDNLGSERVMQKNGMKFEGLLRAQLKMKREFKNQKLYSIIKSDI